MILIAFLKANNHNGSSDDNINKNNNNKVQQVGIGG